MTIDTGFDSVLAGEVYVHPDDAPAVTATVIPEPPCEVSSAPPAAAFNPKPTPSSPSTSATPASSPTALTAAGKQAALALVSLPPLSWPDLSRLAREMAMNLREVHVILKDFKLTQVQYDFLEANNDYYREALRAACTEWHAPMSTQERIKVEAAAILEDSMLGLGARMQNKSEGLPGVIEAAKLFAKIAEVGERSNGGSAGGERVTINIDLGGDTKVTATVAPAPVSDTLSAGRLAISTE